MSRFINISGQRVGRWTVSNKFEIRKKKAYWLCRCDCGNQKWVYMGSLRRGLSKSCGCLNIEVTRTRSTIHGRSNSREYLIWEAMRNRCSNPNNKSFANYGGRGIRVCQRWQKSFAKFFADMGPKPKELTLNRKDNNGPYSPENYEWAS